MLLNAKIVLGENAKTGEVTALYVGLDAAAAEKVFRAAGEDYKQVGYVPHILSTTNRYPAQEKADIADANEREQKRKEAALNAKRTAVESKRAAVAKALEDLKLASIEADPELSQLYDHIKIKNQAVTAAAASATALRNRSAAADEVLKAAQDDATKTAAARERDALAAEADVAEEKASNLSDEAADLTDKLEAAYNPPKKKKI
jgi:chromosome segregation ATPase